MDKNIPKTYSILAILLLIALVISGYMVFNTFWPNYQQAKDTLSMAQTRNSKVKKALADVETFVTSYKEQAANTGRVELALPAGDGDMPNFISSMAQLSSASGVALSNFQINGAGADASASPYSIQIENFGMSASGTFESFKYFLDSIEHHLRLVDIYHVSVKAGSTSSAANATSILEFEVKLHTYFQE